jgi:hypothetical protein
MELRIMKGVDTSQHALNVENEKKFACKNNCA